MSSIGLGNESGDSGGGGGPFGASAATDASNAAANAAAAAGPGNSGKGPGFGINFHCVCCRGKWRAPSDRAKRWNDSLSPSASTQGHHINLLQEEGEKGHRAAASSDHVAGREPIVLGERYVLFIWPQPSSPSGRNPRPAQAHDPARDQRAPQAGDCG